MEFLDGAILAYTESPITPENHVTVLFSLDKEILSPSRQEPGSFEEVRENAFEGSDYDDAEYTGEETSTFEAIVTVLLSIGLPIGLIIWLRRLKKKRAEKKRQQFSERFGYFRELPNEGILSATYALGQLFDVCEEGAIPATGMLRLIQLGCLSPVETQEVGFMGNITVNITKKTVTNAFDKALADATKNGNEKNGITVVLHVDTGSKTGSNVTVNLPKTVQDTIIEKKIVNTIVVLDNPDIRIGMDLETVKKINKQVKSDVNVTATRTDSGKLTAEAKKAIGSRPVFDLKVNYGSGKQVQSFGAGSVSVTIPYTLGANETAGNVQAVYVDKDGKVHWLKNSVYDSEEQVLRFATSHFSAYGIGYKQASTAFTDIAGHWAKEDIEFVVSGGLFSGTSTTTFSPNTAMTRGMFVTTLGRLANADVSHYTKSSFTDVKSDAYYMGYIEWVNTNNIVNGVGNGTFAPDQSITREQMAVIMNNYDKTIVYTLPKVHAENTFADHGKISTYAKETVKQMQMAGVISGKNGNLLDPQGTAARAEVSAVLHRFVELAISSDIL